MTEEHDYYFIVCNKDRTSFLEVAYYSCNDAQTNNLGSATQFWWQSDANEEIELLIKDNKFPELRYIVGVKAYYKWEIDEECTNEYSQLG